MCTVQAAYSEYHVWLSMIIPVYQAEKYLSTCIESVLSQSFGDFELILVDDGSKDSSAQICMKYAEQDHRIRYFHKENGGSLSARLYGIERAAGQYIGFMDADDYLIDDDVFKTLQNRVKEYSCDVVQFGSIKKYNHLKKTVRSVDCVQCVQKDEFQRRDYPLLLCSFWDSSRLTMNVWNKIYRRSLMSKVEGLKEEQRVFWGEDLILNLHLLSNCGSILFLPDAFYVYRQFSGGTSRFSQTEMKDLDTIKKYQIRFAESYEGENTEAIRSFLFSEIAGWFFSYIKRGVRILGSKEMKNLIEEALEYPSFKKARVYYRDRKHIEWEPAKLLVEGNPQAYMKKAGETQKGYKERIKAVLKWLYYRI